jgi:hypothetical protein
LNRQIEVVHKENKPLKSNSCGASFARNTFESPCCFSSCSKEETKIISSLRTETFHLQSLWCKIYTIFTQGGSLNGHMSAVHEVNMVVDMGTVGICEKAVIARENQTYFGENLQFSVIKLFFWNNLQF